MKFTKKILTFILCLQITVIFGQDLQNKMHSLIKKESFYEYWDDQAQEIYSHGWIEQRYGFPVFRLVAFDTISNMVKIEGIITIDGRPSDTLKRGYCPFSILVAQSDSNHYLHNIRYLGKTKCDDDDPNMKNGFFSIEFVLSPNDLLIIGNPGRAGSGAIVYEISKLLKKDK